MHPLQSEHKRTIKMTVVMEVGIINMAVMTSTYTSQQNSYYLLTMDGLERPFLPLAKERRGTILPTWRGGVCAWIKSFYSTLFPYSFHSP